MSDVFSAYEKLRLIKDLSNVELSSTEFHYAYNRSSDRALFAVKIPFPLLKFWHEFVQEDQYKVNFVDLLERTVPGNSFVFVSDSIIRDRISENLRKLAGNVFLQYKTTKGRARKALDEKYKIYHVLEGEIKAVQQWEKEIGSQRNEIEEWRKKYENLEKNKKEMYNSLMEEIIAKDHEINEIKESNAELQEYISLLEKKSDYKGNEVGSVKNKTRTLNCFLSRAKQALWFSRSFGLEIEAVLVKEKSSGDSHKLDFDSKKGRQYNDLTEDEKSRVERVLFLLDKFCVGDQFYHEFSYICNGLPKSYLIKQCRSNLNDLCHLVSLPGPYQGSKVYSVTDLLKLHISDFLKQDSTFSGKIRIKLNGDGARMTRNSNFIILSFAILQSGQDVMSAKGNRTIAIVDSPENYEVLKNAFGSVFKEVNELIKKGSIEVDGEKINTEFFLGGDYKFILLMLGLKSATAHYACAWCKIHKDERWKVGPNFSQYNKNPKCRTLKEIQSMCKQKPTKQNHYNYGCEHEPLLNIELDHVVVDELHLMLRVTDILLENVIDSALDYDQQLEIDRARGQDRGVQLKKTVEHIKGLGISFNVWQEKNADGKESGKYKWTSLTGNDKKKLLREFPKHENTLDLFQNKEHGQTVIDIWNKFNDIYTIINSWTPEQQPSEFHATAVAWVKLFVSLNGKMKGYERSRVTPYMHILVAHVPHFFKLFKSVKIFTGQGVEKNNDNARSVVLRKSNKWDSAGDILRIESRQWNLREHERSRRAYNKRNAGYWEKEIKEKRKRKT